MIFGKTKLELKVGIFVFVGVIILFTFVFSIGKFRAWTKGYRINCVFNFVNGVKIGAPVRFAGVDTGEVKRIQLVFVPQESKTKVKVVCWVRNKIKIPQDSTVWVNTLGLLGEKYIEIIPGKDYTNYVMSNHELIGQDPMPMHEVTELAKSIGKGLDTTMQAINQKQGTVGMLIYDPTLYKNLEEFSDDIKRHPWKLLFKGKEKPKEKPKDKKDDPMNFR